MSPETKDLWGRAVRALRSASRLLPEDPDGAASRAYYSAFHAVGAYFAVHGRTFSKHKAVQSAVHKDLVHAGLWDAELGAAFTWLAALRQKGDYGGDVHVTAAEAQDAIQAARRLLLAVKALEPGTFPDPETDSAP